MRAEKNPVAAGEWEVLPPESAEKPPRGIDDLARVFAWLLDDLFRVPGTRFRFGLDPLISLVPGFGPVASNVASAAIVLLAIKRGVPKIVLGRMALNILVNTALDAVPGIGDLISVWFKSNAMNFALLEKHAGRRHSTKSDWLFVLGLVAAMAFVIALAIGAAMLVLRGLVRLFGGG